jgi:hypothetical protein
MDSAIENCGAFDEAVVFLKHFADLPDVRQSGKVHYPLAEVLLLYLLAVLAGAKTFVDIALFGETKLGLLRRFLLFANRTPSHDHLGDIFANLDAEAFQRCFVAWVASLTGAPAEVIAIDGKTLRRSYHKKGERKLSTWSRLSPRGSVLCSDRSRWRTNPMKSLPSQNCWKCWRSREPW